jgi:hypothetical protein
LLAKRRALVDRKALEEALKNQAHPEVADEEN